MGINDPRHPKTDLPGRRSTDTVCSCDSPSSCQLCPSSARYPYHGKAIQKDGSRELALAANESRVSSHSHFCIESLSRELESVKADLRLIWQVITTVRGLSTTISGIIVGLEVVLLQYFGIKKNADPALANMPGSLLNNGVDSRDWQAKIEVADAVSPMVWQRTEEGSSANYGKCLSEILDRIAFKTIHKVYLVHKHKELLSVKLTEVREDDKTRKLPLGVKGTTDVLIENSIKTKTAPAASASARAQSSNKQAKKQRLANDTTTMSDLGKIRVVCQLKKSAASENARIT